MTQGTKPTLSTQKKLTLSRETLRTLQGSELRHVLGGADNQPEQPTTNSHRGTQCHTATQSMGEPC